MNTLRNVLVVAGLLIGLTAVAVPPAPAAELMAESFRNDSTPAGQWAEVSTFGNHTPCLTAATEPPAGSLKACKSGPSDKPGDGAFQLTDNSRRQGGALLLNKPISSKAGLHVAFDMFQYNSATDFGADGISFFLIDGGQQSVQPGQSGGGLGYDGLAGAIAAVGFDAFGNFSDPKSFGSGPGRQPDHVVLRGAASAKWSYLVGKPSPLPLAAEKATTRERARRTVNIDLSTESVLSVFIDFHDGRGLRKILRDIPLNDLEGQPKLPPTLKLGFAASTGGNTDIHEIRDFSVGVLDPELATTISSDAVFRPGGTGIFQVAVSNDPSGGPTSAPVTVTVPVPAGTMVETAEGDGWTCRTRDGQVVCTRPGAAADMLPPGMSYPPIEIEVRVPPGADGSTVLQATSDTPNNHDPGGGSSDPITVPIEPPE